MDTFVGSQRPSRSSTGSGDRFASVSQVIQPMDDRQLSASSSGESTGKHLGARTASPERLFECDGWCHKRMQPEEALSHPDVVCWVSNRTSVLRFTPMALLDIHLVFWRRSNLLGREYAQWR